MLVNIDAEELYPWVTLTTRKDIPSDLGWTICVADAIDVPDEIVHRWIATIEAWEQAQREMKEVLSDDERKRKQNATPFNHSRPF